MFLKMIHAHSRENEFRVNHAVREGNEAANWLANFARTHSDYFWERDLRFDLLF